MNARSSATPLRSPALERSRLAQRLRRVLKGEVLFDRASRGRYGGDASIYQIEPVGVVVPADEADAAAALDLAREERVPVLARGAGTSQGGQAVGAALVIDHSRHLNRIIGFDRESMTIEVQPGLVLDELNAWLAPHGLWFPVDVASSAQATLGGMAGNNACGARSIVYGNMVHNVLGIEAILSDGTQEFFGPFGVGAKRPMASARSAALVSRLFEIGARERAEIERVWPTLQRRVGGYNLDVFNPRSERPYTADGSVNLAHLLVGSEGTLAYFKRLVLQLAPLPAAKVLAAVNYPSLRAAADGAQHLVGLGPSAVELIDRTMIEPLRADPAWAPTIDALLSERGGRTTQALLLVEFSGQERAPLLRKLVRLGELVADLGLPGAVSELTDEARQTAVWRVRRLALNRLMASKGDGKPVSFIEDCAVPLQHLGEYAERLSEVFRRHGVSGTWYGHASVGTLHVRPMLDLRRGDATKMRAIAEEAAALMRRYKGAFSGEHGDGVARSEWVRWQFGERLTHAFEEIKDLFDPLGLMNPGKIVRAPKMDDATLFRFAPGYATQPLDTALDWSAWDVDGEAGAGFAKAVEMCDNNGYCRKFDAGTMCPSYRVTRDEKHLTRGRANTLRLALSGRLGADGLRSSALREAMALCISCKGCRRECPSSVDMARMKIEYLHQSRGTHKPSLRERLIAYLPHYAPWLARMPWLPNLRNRLPGLPWLGERIAGLSAQRSLPRWHRDRLSSLQHRADAAGSEVVLWADTFNRYFEPANLHAAHRVLEAAGYRVTLAAPRADDAAPQRPLCCGRTFLATGLVDQARHEAQRTLAALSDAVARGAVVVGLEPACLLTMRDEFLVLGLGEAAERLAGRALLFEEFLAREHAAGRLQLALQPLPQRHALLHGHCHQQAFDTMGAVRSVLGLVPQLAVTTIEAGCCGMAGAFGYEAEHHAISMKMAESRLLPAVRQAGADTLLVADGTSCRHQIADATQRRAVHVAQVLERALADAGQGPVRP